jgi:hypothetical protein
MTSILAVDQHASQASSGPRALHRAACVAGVLSSMAYVAVDQLSAARYPGYSFAHQAISELSAIGAPESSARLWSLLGPIYGVLFLAFAIAVLRAGRGNRSLRLTGGMLLAFVIWNLLWPLFPMHQRGTETSFTDLAHLGVGAGSLLLMLSFIGIGSMALGKRFRAFSLATLLAVVVSGVGTFFYVRPMDAGAPTPFLGVVERVMIYAYLLWIAVLAIALFGLPSQRRPAA